MFIAMNRFRIAPGREKEFEAVWTDRDSHLEGTPGFRSFYLLRGPRTEEHSLYCSHSIWESKGDFEAWTRSDACRRAHAQAGDKRELYLGPPVFEGYEPVDGA